MMTKKKTFDCVQMKREASLKIHEQLQGKSMQEQIAYWKIRNELFNKEQEERIGHGFPQNQHNQSNEKDL